MTSQKKVATDLKPGLRCSSCALGRYCLPQGLSAEDALSLEEVIRTSRPIRKGQYLFRAGDPMQVIYAVRAGCFKSTMIDSDGNEHVVGFHLPSELLGLEASYSGRHPFSAVALTTSRVCILPYGQFTRLATESPALLGRLFRLYGKDIGGHLSHAGNYAADERLAAFFLNMGLRLHPRGIYKTRIPLPMMRTDIANFLQLAPATLSRTLGQLERQKLIKANHRTVQITDLDGLRQVARRVPPINL